MKKRLSEDKWSVRVVCLNLFVLFAISGFAMRAATMGSRYGQISMDIPVADAAVEDPRYAEDAGPPKQVLDGKTSVVVLTTAAYYFGELDAFSSGFSDVRNKFVVPHIDGAPNTPRLLEVMGRWQVDKKMVTPDGPKRPVILIPEAEVPASIVIQVAQQLKSSLTFDRVILGTGML